ncbi:MAG: CZB domain-containing protein [Methylococcales bacterium]
MDLNSAMLKHTEWKIKLRSAITKQETLDVITISKDNCCDFGKWLHSDAKTKFGKLASYTDCVSKHATFHLAASKVASAINSKKYAEAEAMLNVGSPYTTASSAVGVAIMRLKKEAGI